MTMSFFFFTTFMVKKKSRFSIRFLPTVLSSRFEDSGCLAEFRVHKRDIPPLADALQIPPTFRYRQCSVCEGIEGLCMLPEKIYDKFKAFTDLEKGTGNFGL